MPAARIVKTMEGGKNGEMPRPRKKSARRPVLVVAHWSNPHSGKVLWRAGGIFNEPARGPGETKKGRAKIDSIGNSRSSSYFSLKSIHPNGMKHKDMHRGSTFVIIRTRRRTRQRGCLVRYPLPDGLA